MRMLSGSTPATSPAPPPSDLAEPLRKIPVETLQRNALLLHRVAVSHGHGVILERVEVDGHRERRADLVLPAIAAADRARVVEVDVAAFAKLVGETAGQRGQCLVA